MFDFCFYSIIAINSVIYKLIISCIIVSSVWGCKANNNLKLKNLDEIPHQVRDDSGLSSRNSRSVYPGSILKKSSKINTKFKHNKERIIQASKANIKLGLAYLNKGINQRAKLKLNRALNLTPKLPEANSAMAYYLEKVGEINEAKIYHKYALLYSKNNVIYLNNYASFLCNNKKYKQALSYYDIALKDKRYINLAIVFRNAGICAFKANFLSEASKYLKNAIKHDEFDNYSRTLLLNINSKVKSKNGS